MERQQRLSAATHKLFSLSVHSWADSRLTMNLVSTPDGRIINLDHLTYAERVGEYLVLHFSGAAEGSSGQIIRIKQGEGARRVWAYLAEKRMAKIETL
jgi:hypothetical protein